MIINNPEIQPFIKKRYTVQELEQLFQFLKDRETFTFQPLPNGLFSAINPSEENQYTGYQNVWVRDTVYVLYAYYLNGEKEKAIKGIRSLLKFFESQLWKITDQKSTDYNNPMNRPHIRFDGETLKELEEEWPHAQNDALGYFIWLTSLIYLDGNIGLSETEKKILTWLVYFLHKIRYWEDRDSGHWEEGRNVRASSIGVVVGGLKLFRSTGIYSNLELKFGYFLTDKMVDEMIDRGERQLDTILPSEYLENKKGKGRKADSALLFLIYPMKIVNDPMAEKILQNVRDRLEGDYGIKRYIGDSFWTADYLDKVSKSKATIGYGDDLANRDRLHHPGDEAQWCIFDPIISIIYGLKYQQTKKPDFLSLQTNYFNRSLGQLTGPDCPYGAFKCPELYYKKNNRFVPNDSVPLNWTQANLWLAFGMMRGSLNVI